jgi:hypothetical protein
MPQKYRGLTDIGRVSLWQEYIFRVREDYIPLSGYMRRIWLYD